MRLSAALALLAVIAGSLAAVPASGDDDRMPCGCRKAGVAKAEEPAIAATEGRKAAGEEFVCPVDAAPGKIASSTPSAEYRGRTYYFCSVEEKQRFLEAPDSFATSVQ